MSLEFKNITQMFKLQNKINCFKLHVKHAYGCFTESKHYRCCVLPNVLTHLQA